MTGNEIVGLGNVFSGEIFHFSLVISYLLSKGVKNK
jgi:6,7-dimethyl-8-ribityllumazine synthase